MAAQRLFASFLFLAACAADDLPPAESDLSTVIMATTTENSADTAAVDSTPRPACEAGQTRECKIFWTSKNQPGVQHCFISTQTCRDDGRAWKACGDTTTTAE